MKIRDRPRFPEPGGGAWKDSSASTRSTSMSRASVKRDLEYMRSRFNAPIEYDRELNGYRFGKPRSGRLRSVTESGCRGALRARGSLDEIVENVALHALDLQPVAGAELGPFLRPCALAAFARRGVRPPGRCARRARAPRPPARGQPRETRPGTAQRSRRPRGSR